MDNTKYLNANILFRVTALTPYREAFEITTELHHVLSQAIGYYAHELQMEIALGGILVIGIAEITHEYEDWDELLEMVNQGFNSIAIEYGLPLPEILYLIVQELEQGTGRRHHLRKHKRMVGT